MSKICGLVSENPNLCVMDILGRMCEASTQHLQRPWETWSSGLVGLGHFSLGAVNLEPQPVVGRESGVAAVSCGKIFDYAVHRQALEQEGITFQSPACEGE